MAQISLNEEIYCLEMTMQGLRESERDLKKQIKQIRARRKQVKEILIQKKARRDGEYGKTDS